VGESSDITAFLACAKAAMINLMPRVVAASGSTLNAVQTKRDGSLVTSVDTLVEAELTAAFSGVFSDTPVLGEESAIDLSAQGEILGVGVYAPFMQSPRQVIIDPIDGTRNFVERKREYCIAAALSCSVSGGIWPVASVVAIPSAELIYWCDEHAAYVEELSSGQARTLTRPEPSGAAVLSVSSRDRGWLSSNGVELVLPWVSSGSSVYDLMQTVLGRQRGSIVGSQRLWDLMAPLAIADRLGFVLRDLFNGEEVRSLCATDLSSDIIGRPWALGRRMLLATPAVELSDCIARRPV
jgi:fructose-1,6-bisphosphatase/inositol monophosphatase family enzyme